MKQWCSVCNRYTDFTSAGCVEHGFNNNYRVGNNIQFNENGDLIKLSVSEGANMKIKSIQIHTGIRISEGSEGTEKISLHIGNDPYDGMIIVTRDDGQETYYNMRYIVSITKGKAKR